MNKFELNINKKKQKNIKYLQKYERNCYCKAYLTQAKFCFAVLIVTKVSVTFLIKEAAVIALRDAIIDEVAAGNMTVVCNGVTSDMLPGLDESKIPSFHTGPIGPHPVGSFEIWTPQEYLPHMLSFLMYHRGEITILFHPLGESEMRDHTHDAMWLGQGYPIGIKIHA